MGMFNFLKNVIREKKQKQWYRDETPIFTSFGSDVYLSDFVANAIDRVATEISKINIKSIIEKDDEVEVQNDDITRAFRFQPNPLQTTSDFLANVEWLRRKNGNAFIYPQYEIIKTVKGTMKRYKAFYPLNPTGVWIGQEDGKVWEIKLSFSDGLKFTIPYDEIIHLKWRRGIHAIKGGGDSGCTNNYSLQRTIDALDKTIQGLPKSIEASMQIKGVYSAKSTMDAKLIKQERDRFEKSMSTSNSGIVAVDLAGEFTPVNIRPPDISEEAMKFLKSVIEERYGVSAAILSADFNGDQHSSLYQTAIEDFINQLEQAFSCALFTERQQDVGHRVRGYYSKTSYMTSKDKMELATLATNTGLLSLNQINEMFGVEPFEGGNRRIQSLNFMNVEDVDEYQKTKVGVKNE